MGPYAPKWEVGMLSRSSDLGFWGAGAGVKPVCARPSTVGHPGPAAPKHDIQYGIAERTLEIGGPLLALLTIIVREV